MLATYCGSCGAHLTTGGQCPNACTTTTYLFPTKELCVHHWHVTGSDWNIVSETCCRCGQYKSYTRVTSGGTGNTVSSYKQQPCGAFVPTTILFG